MKNRKLTRLVNIANEKYPDRMIEYYFDMDTGLIVRKDDDADTLALFIASEISSVFSARETYRGNCDAIAVALTRAMEELATVINAFNEEARHGY